MSRFGLRLGSDGGDSARPRLPGSARVFALGDSRILDNFRSGTIAIEGALTWTRQASLGRMDFLKANCLGVSSATTAALLSSHFAAALSSSAKTLVLLAGTNDCRSAMTAAESIASLDAMIDAWIASSVDRVIIVADEAPWETGIGGSTTHLTAIRDHVRGRHDPAAGVYTWPTWNSVAADTDGLTPSAWSYRDGLHFAKAGAGRAGSALWSVLDKLLPPRNLIGRGGVLSGGDFVANVGGTAPVGWTVPAAAGVTTRFELADSFNWFVVELAGATSFQGQLYGPGTIPAGVTPGSSTLDSHMLYRIDAGSTNLSRVNLELWKQSGTRLLAPTGEIASDGGDLGTGAEAANGPLRSDAFSGILRPPPAVFPADATQLRPWAVTIRGLAGQPASGTIRFAMPQLRLA